MIVNVLSCRVWASFIAWYPLFRGYCNALRSTSPVTSLLQTQRRCSRCRRRRERGGGLVRGADSSSSSSAHANYRFDLSLSSPCCPEYSVLDIHILLYPADTIMIIVICLHGPSLSVPPLTTGFVQTNRKNAWLEKCLPYHDGNKLVPDSVKS